MKEIHQQTIDGTDMVCWYSNTDFEYSAETGDKVAVRFRGKEPAIESGTVIAVYPGIIHVRNEATVPRPRFGGELRKLGHCVGIEYHDKGSLDAVLKWTSEHFPYSIIVTDENGFQDYYCRFRDIQDMELVQGR